MRFEKYVLEDRRRGKSAPRVGEEKDLETFLEETTEYRKMMKGVRLWRAHNHKIDTIKKFMPRTKRIPKDTPKEVHEFIDKFFKTNFGWKARSEGVFASTTPNGVDLFGKYTDLIYPCNGFKFVYSNIIQDLTVWLEDNGYIEQTNTDKWVSTGFNHDGMRMTLLKTLKQEYTDKDLPGASWANTEVMLNCPKGYYMVGGAKFFADNQRYIEGY